MMVLWERRSVTAKELGGCLFLDSGTLTPLLKKLEAKGLVTRHRSEEDERSLIVSITQEGMDLRERARSIPEQMGRCVKLEAEEAQTLYRLLYKLLEGAER
jgi:DNA-binding MarR family transcriptional regulator